MQMKHPDAKHPIKVHPSQIDNMKRRGYVEVKETAKKEVK